ncbi:MAG: Divergent AAA domain protein [Euryarchaeota archaeon ADurb.Bin190]|jgi:hypothetical protein|nr:MAG: Divergent AAA domain protein [Euryarchaeota archaeon ADurb.Bin190]
MSQILEGIPFNEIREAHLNSLIILRIPEDSALEYKLELNIESDTMKRELCKDLSSFANSQGGLILFGVNEEKGFPISINGIKYEDTIKTKLYQIISSGISPRIQEIPERIVHLENGNKIVILRIEPDGYLHQVKYGDNRYYKRVGTITIPMESADIEMFFRQFNRSSSQVSRQEEVQQAIDKYHNMLKGKEYFKGVDDKAICTICIIPEVSSFNLDLSHLPDNFVLLFPPIYSLGWNSELTGNSFFVFSKLQAEEVPHAVTEITAFGEILAYNSSVLSNMYSNHISSGTAGFIPSIAYEREIVNSAYKYFNSLKQLGVSPPFYLDISTLNVKGYYLYTDPKRTIHSSRIYSKEDIHPRIVRIPNDKAYASPQALAKEIRPIFDFIWREFGYEKSYNYDNNGDWIIE